MRPSGSAVKLWHMRSLGHAAPPAPPLLLGLPPPPPPPPLLGSGAGCGSCSQL
jgi:hypothetical protein